MVIFVWVFSYCVDPVLDISDNPIFTPASVILDLFAFPEELNSWCTSDIVLLSDAIIYNDIIHTKWNWWIHLKHLLSSLIESWLELLAVGAVFVVELNHYELMLFHFSIPVLIIQSKLSPYKVSICELSISDGKDQS